MKDDIKKHIENVLEKVTGKGECINADYVKGLLCGVLNSLEPKQAYFQEGDDVLGYDHLEDTWIHAKFQSYSGDKFYAHQYDINAPHELPTDFRHCKKIQILEEGETCIVFKPERPELGEGDKGWIVRFKDGSLAFYSRNAIEGMSALNSKDARYAIREGE